MKKLLRAFTLSLAGLALNLVPVTLSVEHFALTPQIAAAAPTVSPAPTTPDDCKSAGGVWLSVPIYKGQNCMIGDAAHGGVIVAYLKLILKFLAGLVGAVIVLMIIIAGIQYLTSTGDPGQVKAAKNRIINAVTALVLFLFMYAILNFLIPGGILT